MREEGIETEIARLQGLGSPRAQRQARGRELRRKPGPQAQRDAGGPALSSAWSVVPQTSCLEKSPRGRPAPLQLPSVYKVLEVNLKASTCGAEYLVIAFLPAENFVTFL